MLTYNLSLAQTIHMYVFSVSLHIILYNIYYIFDFPQYYPLVKLKPICCFAQITVEFQRISQPAHFTRSPSTNIWQKSTART